MSTMGPTSRRGGLQWAELLMSGDRIEQQPTNFFGDAIREPVDVDEVDRQIINLLERDARLSARAISRNIGMSAGAV